MQSNNPVFRNSDEFKPGYNAYGNPTYAGNGSGYSGYGSDPSTWSVGTPGTSGAQVRTEGPMSVDSVVQRTGLTLLVVIVAAIATWVMTPSIPLDGAGSAVYTAATIGSLGAFVLSLANSFKKVVSPALVLAFAAFEGVAMGALWFLQGAGVVHWPASSFMLDQRIWMLWGGLLAAFGAVLVGYARRL